VAQCEANGLSGVARERAFDAPVVTVMAEGGSVAKRQSDDSIASRFVRLRAI